ncbi:MAG TPA: hypothetical protein VE956_07315 [Nodularia sp. (in: cyanobacteria)]|nr:hypothetical protein [Nodularia sp. (in: cyanobacteria)]
MTTNLPLKFSYLPKSLPLDGAVRIDFVEGVPIFRASSLVQGRIEALLIKQKEFIPILCKAAQNHEIH